jgi:hypothetical protein
VPRKIRTMGDVAQDREIDAIHRRIDKVIKEGTAGRPSFAVVQELVDRRTNAIVELKQFVTDPALPADGDCWFNVTDHKLKIRVSGVTMSSVPFTSA